MNNFSLSLKKKNVQIFLFTLPFLINAQNPTGYIADWKNDAKAAYTIIHDDYGDAAVDGIWQYADTIAANRGVKFVMGAIASSCELNRNINGYSNAYGYAKNVMMAQHGHEMINHSHSHTCAVGNAGWPRTFDGEYLPCDDPATYWGENVNYPDFTTQLVTSHNSITSGSGHAPVYFIFPYDRFTYKANDKLKDMGYIGSRTGWTGPYSGNPTHYREGYEMSDLSTFYPDADGFFRTSVQVFDGVDDDKDVAGQVAELNGEVDNAILSNMWCNRELHNVGNSGWGSVKVESYRQHLNYVKQKMDAGDLWVGTVSEILTYQMQKLKFSPIISYVSASGKIYVNWNNIGAQYSFNVSDYLSPLTIKTPTTLVINLDGLTEDWGVKQNNIDLSSDKFYTSGGKLYINAFPHEGAIEIYPGGEAQNQSPYIANGINNYSNNIGFDDFTIDLKNVFEDNETSDNDLVFTAFGYSGITVDIVNGIATISAPIEWTGTTNVSIKAEDQGGLSVTENFTVGASDIFSGLSPFGGIAASIPGRIQAEDYDEGDAGVAFNEEYSEWAPYPSLNIYRTFAGADIQGYGEVDIEEIPNESAYAVGYTVNGEWLKYTFDVQSTGWYNVSFRVAQKSGEGSLGKIELLVDGNSWMPAIDGIFTESWTSYDTFSYPGGLKLNEGQHVMELKFVKGNINVDYIEILSNPTNSYEIDKEITNIYPNPASDYTKIEGDFDTGYIYSQAGELVSTFTNSIIDVRDLSNGIYFIKIDSSSMLSKLVVSK